MPHLIVVSDIAKMADFIEICSIAVIGASQSQIGLTILLGLVLTPSCFNRSPVQLCHQRLHAILKRVEGRDLVFWFEMLHRTRSWTHSDAKI